MTYDARFIGRFNALAHHIVPVDVLEKWMFLDGLGVVRWRPQAVLRLFFQQAAQNIFHVSCHVLGKRQLAAQDQLDGGLAIAPVKWWLVQGK